MASIAVAWDEAAWRELYPQFCNSVTSEQLSMLWKMAVTLIDNGEGAVLPYDPAKGIYAREIALYALMCHLATIATQDAAGQPGTLTSASEGSVSAGFYMPQFPAGGVSAAWYNQTPCGRNVYMILRRYALGGIYYPVRHVHPFG